MVGGKAEKLPLLLALLLCWSKEVLSQVNNDTVCVTHPTGEMAFRVKGVPGPQGPSGPAGPHGKRGTQGPRGKVPPECRAQEDARESRETLN